MRQVVGSLVALLVSGCLTAGDPLPGRDWGALSCDPGGVVQISSNAPLLPSLNVTPQALAARFAGALGDSLSTVEPDPRRSDERAWMWTTRTGASVMYAFTHPEDETARPFDQVHWSGAPRSTPPSDAKARETIEAFLRDMGVPGSAQLEIERNAPSTPDEWYATLTFKGNGVHDLKAVFDFGPSLAAVSLRPLHDLSRAQETVSAREASETATAYARCLLDRDGKTEAAGYALLGADPAGRAVAHASLALGTLVRFSEPADRETHCGTSVHVLVDAVTRAIHGTRLLLCD